MIQQKGFTALRNFWQLRYRRYIFIWLGLRHLPCPTWLLAAVLLPKSIFRCHISLISFVFEACFSNSRAACRILLDAGVELLPYAPRSLSSPSWFYFISISGLTAFYFQGSYVSGLIHCLHPPSPLYPLPLALPLQSSSHSNMRFQPDPRSPSVSLVSVVLSLSFSLSSCAKLRTMLASTFLLFEDRTAVALADFNYVRRRFDGKAREADIWH